LTGLCILIKRDMLVTHNSGMYVVKIMWKIEAHQCMVWYDV